MPRPEFPNPYCFLTPRIISRIRSNQEYYDSDPERAEREQSAQREHNEEMEQREQQRERAEMEQQRIYEEEQNEQ
jgi:hypothetical protein